MSTLSLYDSMIQLADAVEIADAAFFVSDLQGPSVLDTPGTELELTWITASTFAKHGVGYSITSKNYNIGDASSFRRTLWVASMDRSSLERNRRAVAEGIRRLAASKWRLTYTIDVKLFDQ